MSDVIGYVVLFDVTVGVIRVSRLINQERAR